MKSLDGSTWLINRLQICTNSTVKPFKPLGVGKSTIYKVLQNLENWGATEKQLASGRPAVSLTKGKRKQLVNAAMDTGNGLVSLTKMPKYWEFTRFMFRECLNDKGWSITKENLPKRTSEKARDPTVEALLEAHDPDVRKSQESLSRL